MPRIGIYCRRCFSFVRYGRESELGDLEWLREPCDRCQEQERKRNAELQRLDEMWRARPCAAADCQIVFVPARAWQRFHDPKCRKRTHWRTKAASSARETVAT